MKKSILTFSVFTFIAYSVLISCNNSAQKNGYAGNNTGDTINSSIKDTLGYLSDIDTYKKQIADSIATNDKSIKEFNTRIANEKNEAKQDYDKEINALDKENGDLKWKLDEYKAEGKAKWETFKAGFSHDMYELGKSIKNLKDKIV